MYRLGCVSCQTNKILKTQFFTRLSLGIPPPPPPGGLPRMPPPPFVNPSPPVAPPMSSKREADGDDSVGKKSRTEPAEANLIPEDEFLASNPNPVTFGVQIPLMPDKAEWKLDGNTIRLTLPLTDQVSGRLVTSVPLFHVTQTCDRLKSNCLRAKCRIKMTDLFLKQHPFDCRKT